MSEPKRKCAGYLRVSHQKQMQQVDQDDADGKLGGLSLEAQTEQLELWVRAHDLDLDPENRVVDVQSAQSAGKWNVSDGRLDLEFNRSGFAGMVEALAKPNGPKVLVTQDWDRLTRNAIEFDLIRELIVKHGVEVHTFRDSRIVNSSNWKLNSLQLGINIAMAGDESSTRTARVQDVRVHKAEVLKLFVGNRPPPGYRWKPLDGSRKQIRELEVIPELKPKVIELFRMVESGSYNYNALYEWCVAAGLFAPAKKSKAKLYKLVRNPIYIGGFNWKPPGSSSTVSVLEGKNPAIVPRTLWFKVQEVLAAKSRTPRKRTTRFHVLEALMECSACGCRMSPVTPNPKKRDVVYWTCKQGRCARSPSLRDGGHQKFIPDSTVKKQLAEFLDAEVSFHSSEQALVYQRRLKRRAAPVPPLEQKRKALQAKRTRAEGRCLGARRMLGDAALDAEDYDFAKQQLQQAKLDVAGIANELLELDSTVPTPERVATAFEMIASAIHLGTGWLELTPSSQREFLEKLLAPPTGRKETARLPIRFDWEAQRVVGLSLQPAWSIIAQLAASASNGGGSSGGLQVVNGSGGRSVDTPSPEQLLEELLWALQAA